MFCFNGKTEKYLKLMYILIFATTFFILGTFFGIHFKKIKQNKIFSTSTPPIRANSSALLFTDPLLLCNFSSPNDLKKFLLLKQKIDQIIKDKQAADQVKEVSVYFHDPNGHWFGINEDLDYPPASLFKVVVMMAFYSKAEKNPLVLNQLILVNKNSIKEVNTSTLRVGEQYTIQELIEHMIVNSDNTAKNILLEELGGSKYLDQIFLDLGIEKPNDKKTYYISAKNYSYFFRILYNATYLNREYSEKALNLLTKTIYKNGLVSGIPEVKTIAHKYGDFFFIDDAFTGVGLHDCGIIYSSKGPYFLCIMTTGHNLANSEKVIQEIAHMVNEEYEK